MRADSGERTPKRPTITVVLVAGILAASTASIFIRFAQAQGAPALAIAAGRLGIAALVLAPIALLRHRAELRGLKRSEWGLGLLSGVFLAVHFAAWITSLQFTSVASSVVLVTTTPLWVALLSPLVLKERLTRMVAAGLGLALLGGVVVGVSDACRLDQFNLICPAWKELFAGKAFAGDLLALLGAWMAAGYILVGRKLRSRMTLIPYVFLVYGAAALVLLAALPFAGQRLTGFPPLTYLWFVLLALIPQLLGHTSFNWALRYVPASFVSVILLGEPIGSTLLAIILLQEMPGWLRIAGGVLILAGIYLAAREQGKAAPLMAQKPLEGK